MSKAVTNELKMVITTTIDELYDAIRAEKITIPDATIALRNQLNDIEGSIYTLNNKYLIRAFTILGENVTPSMRTGREVQSARELFKKLLCSGKESSEIIGSDNENEQLDVVSVGSDEEIKEREEKKHEEEKKTSISTNVRESPRKIPSADRAVRAAIVEINEVSSLRAEMLKLHQQNEARNDRIRILEKENEVRRQKETVDLTAALNAIPSIGDGKHGKKPKKASKGKDKLKPVDKIGHSVHLTAQNTLSDSSDLDTSSSGSNSDFNSSSSSSSNSSSSDSDHKSSRGNRKKRSKRSTDRKERHAKSFINNVGKDGVLVYIHRIFTKTTADHVKVDLRSMREAEVIANAIDAFIANGVKISTDGIEVLVTRLIGLIYAIQTGEWTVATAIQYTVAGTSTLPLSSSQMAKLAKRGQRIKALTSVAPKSRYERSNTGTGVYEHNNGTGYQKYSKQNQNVSQTGGKFAAGSVGTGSEKASSKAQ